MKTTRLEKKIDDTEKLRVFEDEDITKVEALEHQNKFILTNKDMLLIQHIADKYKISYDEALSDVIRKALDLYNWHINNVKL